MALIWVLALGLVNSAWAASATNASGVRANNAGHGVAAPRRAVPRHGAAFVSQTPPPTLMMPGQTARVELRLRNTGKSTWTAAAGYKLGSQNPSDNAHWRKGRLAVPSAVLPGQEVVFGFEIKAPERPGAYHFKWRMVRERVEWFGHFTHDVEVNVMIPEVPVPPIGPNPNPGAWDGKVPDMRSVVDDIAARHPDLFGRSCQDAPGGSWGFMDKVVSELRARNRRFGYNCKRGNCNDPSQDGVAYYAGYGDPSEGAGPIVWIDTIVAHCGDSRPSWQVFPFDNKGNWISKRP